MGDAWPAERFAANRTRSPAVAGAGSVRVGADDRGPPNTVAIARMGKVLQGAHNAPCTFWCLTWRHVAAQIHF